MDPEELRWKVVEWIDLAESRDRWLAHVHGSGPSVYIIFH